MYLNASGILYHVSASCLVYLVFASSLDGLDGTAGLMSRLTEELKI
jgi:hypothetical protein